MVFWVWHVWGAHVSASGLVVALGVDVLLEVLARGCVSHVAVVADFVAPLVAGDRSPFL